MSSYLWESCEKVSWQAVEWQTGGRATQKEGEKKELESVHQSQRLLTDFVFYYVAFCKTLRLYFSIDFFFNVFVTNFLLFF